MISKHNLKHQDQQSPNIHSLDEIKPDKLLFEVFVFIKIFHISDFTTTGTDTNSLAEKSKLLLTDRLKLAWLKLWMRPAHMLDIAEMFSFHWNDQNKHSGSNLCCGGVC